MSDNLLEMAVRHLGSSGLGALGNALGLPSGQSESAVSSGISTVLAGMLNKAGSESGLGSLLNMVTNSGDIDLSSPADIFSNPESMASLQKAGGGMVDNIFGNKSDGIINLLTSSLGLSGAKGGSLLKIAAPVVMSLVGKLVKSKGLNMQGLASLLMGQKSFIKDKVPGGLLKELGASNFDELAARTVKDTAPHKPVHVSEPVKKGGFGKWLWPLLIALGALYALNMCSKKEAVEHQGAVITEDEAVIVEPAPEPAEPMVEDVQVDFGQSLRDYLASATRDPNQEFPLDIEFPTDGTMPNSSSIPDVQTLITILQGNAGLAVAIEGHTDSDGDAGANQQLSEQRAQAVRQMLIDAGIAEDRVTALGMGSANPVADNTTEEGKQKNRRISVKVTKFE